jgi:hypothetical protein
MAEESITKPELVIAQELEKALEDRYRLKNMCFDCDG